MPEAIFGCREISLALGGRDILKDVAIDVAPGEVLGLVGPNGAGKTSLFEVLTGRYVANRGEVFFTDRTITRHTIHDRARMGLARTYQSPIVPSAMSVDEVFRAARFAHRPYLSRFDAEHASREAGLKIHWDRPAGSLDTFDRRKLLLACLLLRRPRVLLLDEPASGLINSEIDELDLIIRRQVDEHDIAVIAIEHRLELLAAISERVVVLDLGRVIAAGTPDEVFNDPRVHAAYFAEPDHA